MVGSSSHASFPGCPGGVGNGGRRNRDEQQQSDQLGDTHVQLQINKPSLIAKYRLHARLITAYWLNVARTTCTRAHESDMMLVRSNEHVPLGNTAENTQGTQHNIAQ